MPKYLFLLASIGGLSAFAWPGDARRRWADLGLGLLGLLLGAVESGLIVGAVFPGLVVALSLGMASSQQQLPFDRVALWLLTSALALALLASFAVPATALSGEPVLVQLVFGRSAQLSSLLAPRLVDLRSGLAPFGVRPVSLDRPCSTGPRLVYLAVLIAFAL